jgi:secondary thiamine-phosphate synthase enzyme
MWIQKEIQLNSRSRGFHLITDQIIDEIPEINNFKIGLLTLFMKHTSASLCINEDADPAVRQDFEHFFNRYILENEPYYTHTDEGPDDMPAHLKSSVLGNTLNIPVTNGKLNMGTWQGIYLGEHRNHATGRKIVLTLQGETA